MRARILCWWGKLHAWFAQTNSLLKTRARTCGSKPFKLSETTVSEGIRGSDMKVEARGSETLAPGSKRKGPAEGF